MATQIVNLPSIQRFAKSPLHAPIDHAFVEQRLINANYNVDISRTKNQSLTHKARFVVQTTLRWLKVVQSDGRKLKQTARRVSYHDGYDGVLRSNLCENEDEFLEAMPEDLANLVDNAPVRSLVHKGITIEGYSRAAVQTYWRIPEMKVGFDLGAQPWSFMTTPTWFVSHAHLDHLASLPIYVARRRMMKMEPPTIYLPAHAIEGVGMLLRAWQRLDRGRMPANLVPMEPGQEFELSRELVVQTFATKHTIPSLGFLIWERRKKLRPEYLNLSGDEIRDLRLSGVEISTEIRIPKVAYLGDTAPGGLEVIPEIYKAEVLIMEMTFVAPNERPERIHKYGHTHLDDFIARADRFENEVIIASHFSTRLPSDAIQRIVDRKLPENLRSRLKVWL